MRTVHVKAKREGEKAGTGRWKLAHDVVCHLWGEREGGKGIGRKSLRPHSSEKALSR